MYCIWILLLSLPSWLLGQDPCGQAPYIYTSGNSISLLLAWIQFVTGTVLASIYAGFPCRWQLMTTNKLPRAWWKLCSSERSTRASPTIASPEQRPSTCAAWGIRNGRLKMRCTQVSTLLKIFHYILKNRNVILKYSVKPVHCCSKGKLCFCNELFFVIYSLSE